MSQATREPDRRQWWRVYFIVGALVVLGYVFLPPGVESDLLYVAIGASSVISILVGVSSRRPARRGGWYLMASGLALWVVGDAIGSYIADVIGEDLFPTPADPIYLAAYPVLAASFFWLTRRRRGPLDRAGLLDAAVVIVGLGLLAWVLLAAPALEQYQSAPIDAAVAVAYPVGDILLVAVLVAVLTTPGGRSRAMRLLLIAIVLQVVPDALSTGLGLLTFTNTRVLDPLWLMSYVCWGTAALHPSMVSLSDPVATTDARIRRGRFTALVVAVMIAPAILAVQQLLGFQLAVWPVVVGSVGLFGLVMARMHLAIHDMMIADHQREQLEADLAHQASHDPVTDLPNRSRFRQGLRRTLSRSNRDAISVGLVVLDLDDFKTVNDTHGYASGDDILRTVARRLRAEAPQPDGLARVDGDAFAVLVDPVQNLDELRAVAARLTAAIGEPITVGAGRRVTPSFSAGAVLSRPSSIDPEELLHEADLALERAQIGGRGRIEMFDDVLRDELAERSSVERAVSAALTHDDLELRFYPTLELVSEEIQWFAASVYWQRGADLVAIRDVDLGNTRPDLIRDVDGWAIREAVRRLFTWRARPDVAISLEISGERLKRPGLGPEVARALGDRVSSHRLAFKFDAAGLDDDPVIKNNLRELRALGIGLAVTGFGTGRSVDSRLAGLPLDAAVIDLSAVRVRDQVERRQLDLLIETAQAFGLRAVAVDVRTTVELRMVERLGFTAARGPAIGSEMGALEATASLDHGWTSPL